MAQRTRDSFFWKLSVAMLAAVSAMAFIYALAGENGYLELRKRRQQKQELGEKAKQIRQENRELLGEIKALKSDPKVIERIAREELGMVRPGEVKITTNPDRQNPDTVPPPSSRRQP